jgi:hypothetical protein
LGGLFLELWSAVEVLEKTVLKISAKFRRSLLWQHSDFGQFLQHPKDFPSVLRKFNFSFFFMRHSKEKKIILEKLQLLTSTSSKI